MINCPDTTLTIQDFNRSGSMIKETAVELRQLLSTPPSKRQANWQDLTTPLICAIASDFSKQQSAEIALLDLALISLAAQKGCKEAKKRSIRPIRWIADAPPSIADVFDDVEEARCAIRLLQPIKAEWVPDYICSEFTKIKWPILTPSFVDWLLQTTPTVEQFFRVLGKAMSHISGGNYHWMADVLEAATKTLSKSSLAAGHTLMSEVADLAVLIGSIQTSALNDGDLVWVSRIKSALLALISKVSSIEPSVLTQGAFVAALKGIYALPGSMKKGDSVGELEIMCRRSLSLLSVLLASADQVQRTHYSGLWAFYKIALPKADQLLKSSARQFPILLQLEPSQHEVVPATPLGMTAGLEGVLCELIVNWDDYRANHSNDPAVEQISARIAELIRQLGVARFGEVGKLVAFDPILHYLPADSPAIVNKVKITKQGIALERPDGTSRVLLMAAVAPNKN